MWSLSWRLARRELRGGLAGFRIFLACLALGVAAIAGVGSLTKALVAGLSADGRKLLSGDVELRLTHQAASGEQVAWLRGQGRLSRAITMRTMAYGGDGRRTLVELKGVDALYPLYGRLVLDGGGALSDALTDARSDTRSDTLGAPGAIVEASLLRRLGLATGDSIRIGDVRYRVADTIAREPDRADGIALGPRIMVRLDSLAATGLIQEGSMIRYRYRLALPAGTAIPPWLERLKQRFPDAGWRIRDVRNGAPGLRRFIDRMNLFLTLVGLTALLVGGLGVANAVKGFLDRKTGTIAILKCVGAPAAVIFCTYLLQILVIASVGIALGLAFGAALPGAAALLLNRLLPFEAVPNLYVGPLLLAALYGYLTALAFALWPLARAREVAPGALFRDLAAPITTTPRPAYIAATAGIVALLAVIAVATAELPRFAGWFVLGSAASLLLFAGTARAIIALARRLPRPRRPGWRLALANLHRPGAPTTSVVLSFGLGLSVLVAIATLEGNITRQVSDTVRERAPAYFFIDIQPGQVGAFETLARGIPGVGAIEKVPSLRGRITRLDGVPVQRIAPAPEVAWILRGDRGLTYAREKPEGAELVAGTWWPADYAGPPLLSFDAEAAAGLGLGVGDSVTINVLGREITAGIHNLRRIDWSTMGINFVMVFSPGLLESAPHSFIATARATREAELPLEVAVTDRFANVTAIRIRDALEAANRILDSISIAIRATASLTLIAGILVLAGTIAAGHRRRVYDAVVLKVLGATRRDVIGAYFAEFAMLGTVTALLAALIGGLVAYVIMTQVLDGRWVWLPGTIFGTAAISVAVTIGLGMIGTWRALSQRPAPLLRNE